MKNKSNYIIPQTSDGCTENRIHWANSEYVERKEFTEREKAVIRPLDKVNWVARDRDGIVYGYINEPKKQNFIWSCKGEGFGISFFTSCEFKAIKWEDTEPTSREEILGEKK